MRNRFAVALFLIFSPPVALALDQPSVQVYCDNVKKAALEAQARYIQTAQPRQDPVQTFDDSVSSCLGDISGIQLSIPSVFDALLSTLGKQLTNRICQAARNQFNKAVGDAMQSVNGAVGGATGGAIPGVGVSTSTAPGVSVQNDGGAAMKNTATTAVDRVMNTLR